LKFHPPLAVAVCRDKFVARERFRTAGLLVPEFYRIPVTGHPAAARFYPCVLKPLALSASRGVIRADNDGEFTAAFARIRALLEHEQMNDFIQVESFIPGREFALEGMVRGGELEIVALFDKPDPLDGPFFEETIYVTPSREPAHVQAAIQQTTSQAIAALGLTDGPIHAEMRMNERGVWMLEVAARPIGGLCAKAIPGLEELILRRAVGEDASVPKPAGASGVMMIPIPRAGVYNGVTGVAQAENVPGITEVIVTAKQGHKIVPLPEGSSYLGFLFARGATPGEVEQALRAAHDKLEFEILAALPVI
jgi:biotin carboxylase